MIKVSEELYDMIENANVKGSSNPVAMMGMLLDSIRVKAIDANMTSTEWLTAQGLSLATLVWCAQNGCEKWYKFKTGDIVNTKDGIKIVGECSGVKHIRMDTVNANPIEYDLMCKAGNREDV